MKELTNKVYWVGANDWEVRHFHGYELSTHKGTSYNAYFIKDEKNVLIDTVWEALSDLFLERVKEVTNFEDIDYIVVNHAEPDHSGALPKLMELCPNATVIVSRKGLESVQKHYHKEWNFKVVSTGDELDIGENKLTFVEAPMLHWPDSMFTYLSGKNILFSNDAFGQHMASSDLFNDMVDEAEVLQEALKYYANILTPFSRLVTKKIQELVGMNLPIDMIAPSHGIIWRKNPLDIVNLYAKWAEGLHEDSVVIIYNSMWGATKRMAEHIGMGLDQAKVSHKLYNVATADRNDVLTEIFRSRGIICGSSTVNNGILASLSPVLDELKGLKYTNKVGASFGSYGWSGESPKILDELLTDAKVKIIQDYLKIMYMPTEEELQQCIDFGASFGKQILSK